MVLFCKNDLNKKKKLAHALQPAAWVLQSLSPLDFASLLQVQEPALEPLAQDMHCLGREGFSHWGKYLRSFCL